MATKVKVSGDDNGEEEDRLFTSDFVFATLANFVNAFGLQMLVATLPVYVINLGGSHTDAGLVSGVMALTALLFRPFMGWLTDTWHRRPVVLIGTACYGLASLIYLLGGAIPFLVLGRSVHGFGTSCYSTASTAYIADIAPPKRRAEAIGLFFAANAFGIIIGPVIGFMLVEETSFPHLFYFTGGLAITAFFISLFARERQHPVAIKNPSWSPRTGIVAIESLPVAWIALCMGIGLGAVHAFISIFALLRGVGNPGFYFMTQAMALFISRIYAGRLADRRSRAVVIVSGVILTVSALAVLPLAHGFPLFVVSALLLGLGFGTVLPASMALLIDRVRPERRGLATSTYYTGYDAGNVIGSILLGLASQQWGFGVMWMLASAFTLLGLIGLLGDRH
ncbi:MAG: MFS transporter [Deltaproteobacteria bacterium]|nr:MFS transporter [Deltaproteobacteria bacterium]